MNGIYAVKLIRFIGAAFTLSMDGMIKFFALNLHRNVQGLGVHKNLLFAFWINLHE
jgi:hypothetical protein